MRFEAVPIAELDATLVQAWSRIQSTSKEQVSPFFGCEFSQAVGRCRTDFFIGVIENAGQIYGVLPFHRKSGASGAPVGGQICDYQGVIGQPVYPQHLTPMLKGFQLDCYDFNHALASDEIFLENAIQSSQSPRADLRGGYQAWYDTVSSRSSAFKRLARKGRKIERELGPLQFIENDQSDDSWTEFVRLQAASMQRRGQKGFFSADWVARLIGELRGSRDDKFGGCFSTLYAGNKLIAGHFGLRNTRCLHWWFPAYDPALSVYSPGLLLLQHCIEAAANAGCDELDLGRGQERYKLEFSNASRMLCEGSLERPFSAHGILRTGRKAVLRFANRSLPDKIGDIMCRGSSKMLGAGYL